MVHVVNSKLHCLSCKNRKQSVVLNGQYSSLADVLAASMQINHLTTLLCAM